MARQSLSTEPPPTAPQLALRAGARSRAKAAMATGANAAAPTAWTAERAWEAEAEEVIATTATMAAAEPATATAA